MLAALMAARVSGWLAIALLWLALLATPVSHLLRASARTRPAAARLPRYRRLLGIAAAACAMVHAGIALSGYLRDALEAVITWPHLRAGLVALAILVVLLLTSFPAVTRVLRVRVWKPLHRLSYAAAALALLHLALSPFAARSLVVALGGLLALAFAVRVVVAVRGMARPGRPLGRARPGPSDQSGSFSSPSLMSTSAPKSPSVMSP